MNNPEEMSKADKMWAEHYERLLKVEFEWDPEHQSNKQPKEGLPIWITIDMVKRPSVR